MVGSIGPTDVVTRAYLQLFVYLFINIYLVPIFKLHDIYNKRFTIDIPRMIILKSEENNKQIFI